MRGSAQNAQQKLAGAVRAFSKTGFIIESGLLSIDNTKSISDIQIKRFEVPI